LFILSDNRGLHNFRYALYRVAISVAVGMLKQGLISDDEYRIINNRMIEKYKPLFGGLIR